MAEVWKPQPIEIYCAWCDAITEEASERITNWEASFLSQIVMRLNGGINLTQGQANKLEQIYTQYTS